MPRLLPSPRYLGPSSARAIIPDMSQTVEDAIARLRQMPEDRQEKLAGLLLHEIEEDDRWLKSTAAHSDKLSGFVAEVLDADRRGESDPLDPETL